MDHDELARTQPIPRRGSLAALAATLPDDYLWYPGADREPLSVNIGGELRATRGLVLHVQQGKGDLFGWFSRASAQVSAHFWVSKTGRVVQYIPTVREAWAQRSGNDAWLSAETEGYDHEPLTDEQITALRGIYTWGAARHGWPWTLADSTTSRGLGWHGMGGRDWGNHPGCPGELRKAQRIQIIATAPEDDVTEQDKVDIANKVLTLLRDQVFSVQPAIRQGNAGQVLGATYNKVGALQTTVADLGGVVSATQAVVAGIAEAVAAAVPAHGPGLREAAARLRQLPRPVDVALGAIAAIDDTTDLAALAAEVHHRASILPVPSPITITEPQ